jgi:hypothetical protein
MTWWFDERDRIVGAMVRSWPGNAKNRLQEFRDWAAVRHPAELEHLMPNGKIDPTGDRAEKWKVLLPEWREAAGLPKVD